MLPEEQAAWQCGTSDMKQLKIGKKKVAEILVFLWMISWSTYKKHLSAGSILDGVTSRKLLQ